MSLFDLPTSANKPDSYASAFRYDQVNPTSAISATGGGAITFEVQSPANNFFIPRLSYFDFRFKILENSDGTALDKADGETGDHMQFAEYPASQVVHTFSHSINGASVETVSDCPELSAIQSRTMMPHDFFFTFGDSFRLGHRVENQAARSVEDALQPWDGTVTTFSAMYQPPAALFRYGGSLPGLRQRMVLTITNDLKKAVLADDTTSVAKYSVALESVTFYAAHVIPERPIAPPSTCVLSLPFYSMTKQFAASTGATTQTYSIAPSTDKVYVVKNDNAPDNTVAKAPHMFHNDIKSIEMQYAGQRMPHIAYTNLEAGSTVRDTLRAYLDYAATTGRFIRAQGMPDTNSDWEDRPIYAAAFEKPANDASTSLTVRVDVASTGNICVMNRHHKAIVIRYSSDGLAETVDVQEDLS